MIYLWCKDTNLCILLHFPRICRGQIQVQHPLLCFTQPEGGATTAVVVLRHGQRAAATFPLLRGRRGKGRAPLSSLDPRAGLSLL